MPDGCGGRSLALAAPRAVASAVADGQGLAVLEVPVPDALAGRTVRLQAPADCLFSDVLVHTF